MSNDSHVWFCIRQTPHGRKDEGPFSERELVEEAKAGRIGLETRMWSPTKTQGNIVQARQVANLAVFIHQAWLQQVARKKQATEQELAQRQARAVGDSDHRWQRSPDPMHLFPDLPASPWPELNIKRKRIPSELETVIYILSGFVLLAILGIALVIFLNVLGNTTSQPVNVRQEPEKNSKLDYESDLKMAARNAVRASLDLPRGYNVKFPLYETNAFYVITDDGKEEWTVDGEVHCVNQFNERLDYEYTVLLRVWKTNGRMDYKIQDVKVYELAR